MSPVSGPHLTPDDFDAWFAGAFAPDVQVHLAGCPACRERAETDPNALSHHGDPASVG